jgi:hypothetical protein
MVSRVPPEIRICVLVLWLRACSRDNIARIVGLGTGIVSEILKEYNQRDPEFVLLREFVVAVKNEQGNINQLASAIRLQRILESHNLRGEQIESLIRNVANHCFKKEVGVDMFIEDVDKISKLADNTGIAIEKLPDHIHEKRRELYSVIMDLSSKKAETAAASQKCDEKKVQLEYLTKSLAKIQTIKGVQFIDALEKKNLVRALDYVISEWSRERLVGRYFRNLLENELGRASKKTSGDINQSKNHRSTATKSALAKSTTN